jgi:phosphatidate cytidylyltransferase
MNWSLSNLSELNQRIIAALVGAVLILSCTFYSEWTYFAIFFLICMFTQLEFYKLLGIEGNLPLRKFGTFTGQAIFTLTFLVEKYNWSSDYYFLIWILVSGVYFIKLYEYIRRDLQPFVNIAFTFLGIIYVAVPFALLNMAVFHKEIYSYQIMIGSLFLIWASDTGAYFAGRKFGKNKLFFKISPKKTWEGSIGGTLLALLLGYILSIYFKDLSLWQWLCIAVIIVVTGTYGDLVESLFKRSIRIKDSGNTIPGHGGFLDRFDSLLLSSPFIVAFVKLFS